ncbi:hypothetical protein V6K52_15450 [Knoellia sp. S7-12]|uniref:hypothetical protein n=1 Tax=Knoellia sp. S7-12 TaxID=3126698 RepID=UPI003366D3B6
MKRWSRVSSLGALILVAAVCATTSPVTASAAAPTLSVAPRNELTIVAPAGAVVPSVTTQTPGITGFGSSRTWATGTMSVQLSAFTGETFKVGTFQSGHAAGRLGVSITNNGASCTDGASSRVTVHEFTYDGDGLTSLAATLQANCSGTGQTVAELRFNSTVGAQRVGGLRLGQDGALRRVTLTTPEATTVQDIFWAGDLTVVVKANTCNGASLPAGGTCYVDVVPRTLEEGGEYIALSIRDAEAKRLDTVSITALGLQSPEGAYTPLATAKRFLDTRPGNVPLRAGTPRDLQVLGVNGMPSTGISTVVVNITVVAPNTGGYLTAYPAGTTAPTASSMNFSKGQTIANLVTVRANAGKIRLLTSATTHVLVDVVGYYRNLAGTSSDPRAYGSFQQVEPYRLYDSRKDVKVNGYEIFDLWTDFGDDFNRRTKALAINVTVVAPEGPGHLTVWNGLNSTTVPNTSTLNFTAGRTVPNMTVVPVSLCYSCNAAGTGVPAFSIANASSKRVHVVVDVVGVFDDNSVEFGSRLKPLATPKRVVDTRASLGFKTLGAGATGTASAASVSTPWTTSLSGNLTAVGPTKYTWLTIWEAGTPKSGVSSMNPYPGQNVAAMVMPGISDARQFSVNNAVGTTNVILDVVGTFEFYNTEEYAPETGVFTADTGLVASEAPGALTKAPDSKGIAPDKASASRTGSPASAPASKVNSR